MRLGKKSAFIGCPYQRSERITVYKQVNKLCLLLVLKMISEDVRRIKIIGFGVQVANVIMSLIGNVKVIKFA